MKKGFSLINIVIFFCALAFFYLIYDKYYKPKKITEIPVQNQASSSPFSQNSASSTSKIQPPTSNSEPEKLVKITRSATTSKDIPADEGGSALPNSSTLPKEKPQTEITTAPTEPTTTIMPTTNNGYYENTNYNYSLTCPSNWPLRIRSAENVSIGTVPPENGQGAITIEVTTDNITGELKAAEAEAKKYPGIITITKEKTTIDGVIGDRIIMTNSLVNTKNIYIVLQKNNLNYSIKYAHESSPFVIETEAAIKTFKFTK